jgi:hypothetical protein
MGVIAFHQGCCFMVATALKAVLGGSLWALAERENAKDVDSSQTTDEFDWPLQHYLLWKDGFLLDSTGIYPERTALNALRRSTFGYGENRTLRLAPVKSKWPDNGLWEGDHWWAEDKDWIYDKLVADAKQIWDTCLKTND